MENNIENLNFFIVHQLIPGWGHRVWERPHETLVVLIPLALGLIKQVIGSNIDPNDTSRIVFSCFETFSGIGMQEFCINPTLGL